MEENYQGLGKLAQSQQTPETNKAYWVQCSAYKTIALVDKDGKWRVLCTGQELPDVINFFPTGQSILELLLRATHGV